MTANRDLTVIVNCNCLPFKVSQVLQFASACRDFCSRSTGFMPKTINKPKAVNNVHFIFLFIPRSTLMATIHKVELQEIPSSKADDEKYYVTLKILPQNHRSFQTKAVKKSKSLEFKERFEFRVAYEKLHAQSLKVTLCSFDRFSQHEPLGDHTVHLADLEARGLSLSREILLFRDIQTVQKVMNTAVS